ncbi:Cytochrome P450 [Metarhizium rileyi]|uniref:Cytochrome P450 n=1 Tax=Metarhizium rileyi (strain RCEF 4871) TaxID=1649241 RepID=A0A167CK06_METRR|nr:Cytochrome P450 [Metarhizium rileyi RCEF 4871]
MLSASENFWSDVQLLLWEKPVYTILVAVSTFCLIVVSSDYLDYAAQRRRIRGIATVGDAPYIWRRLRWTESQSNLRGVLQRGYNNFTKKSKPFAYPSQHDDFVIVVPPDVGEEVKNIGPERLSFLQAVEDAYHFRLHTNILGRSHVDAVRKSVNKNMGHLHNTVVQQAEKVIPRMFDDYGESQEPFVGFLTVWNLVHTVSSSYLVGPEFSLNEQYMADVQYYCLMVPEFVHQYFRMPGVLRKAFWYLSPQGFKVRSSIKRLKRIIIPEIRNTIDAWRQKRSARDQFTMLGAILDIKQERGQLKRDAKAMSQAEETKQVDIFADEVIFTAFDSAGPVACLLIQMIFESICDKELSEALRDEIAAALAVNNGEWSEQTLSSLPRLESFTRETLRVNGPTLFSVTRTAIQPLKLNSGLSLRRGEMMTTPSWYVHNDEDNYENASEFNPYRFYDEATNMATTRATTPSSKFLAYGYGVQICPGRFLGIRMTQILFAKLLMRYDMKMANGAMRRPDNIFMPGQVLPPYMASIVFSHRHEKVDLEG